MPTTRFAVPSSRSGVPLAAARFPAPIAVAMPTDGWSKFLPVGWVVFAVIGVLLLVATAAAQPPLAAPSEAGPVAADGSGGEIEELTRGIVHEAYAQPVVFNPQPSDVVVQAPPQPIEELPPEEKPAGDNVEWIQGYWSWDDDESHYVWVSGIWRAVPPGLDWVPGYWSTVEGGHQWVSGFWRAEQTEELEYLPEPPASVERGPALAPPSPDHVWVSGCWTWMDSRYLWRPGYWVVCRPGWVWVPARFVWTPFGYLHVDGYWDYALPRRGVIYAPIWFPRGPVVGHHYRYTPRVVIDVQVFSFHMFCRPARSVYCFGDYYEARYFDRGIYPGYAYHMSRYGYDPLFAYHRWEHLRTEPNWHERVRADYRHRRDHAEDRPPHTVIAARELAARSVSRPDVQNLLLATSLSGLAKRPELGFKVETVSQQRRSELQTELARLNAIQDRRREVELRQARELADQRLQESRERINREMGKKGPPDRVTTPGRVIIPGQGDAGTGIVDLPGQRRDDVGKGRPHSHKVNLFGDSLAIAPKDRTDERPGDRGDGGKPAVTLPGAIKPGLGRPEFGRPEIVKPEIGKPDGGKPDSGKPDSGKPDGGKPEIGRPDGGKPEIGKPEIGRPDLGRPDRIRPDRGRPEVGKPDGEKPDLGKPEVVKPELGRPNSGKPDGAGPSGARDPNAALESLKMKLNRQRRTVTSELAPPPRPESPQPDPRSVDPRANDPRREPPRVFTPGRTTTGPSESARDAAAKAAADRERREQAAEEMRRNNAKRVEDLQRQLRERQEAAKNRGNDAPRVTVPRNEPPRVTPPRSEPPRVTPPRNEPPRVTPPRNEPPRFTPPRNEPPRNEPPRGANPRPNPPSTDRGNNPPKLFLPRSERNEKKKD